MNKRILVVDFDGVLHSYTSGWKGANVVSDPPVPGAMQFLIDASRDFEVHIFSSRSHQEGGRVAMADWLALGLCGHCRDTVTSQWQGDTVTFCPRGFRSLKLHFPTIKPPAHLSIDDRGWQFNGTFPSMQ